MLGVKAPAPQALLSQYQVLAEVAATAP